MKKCIDCHLEKELKDFGIRSRNADGYQNICKICKRSYDNLYHKNKSIDAKRQKISIGRARRNHILGTLCTHKLSVGCIDCGYNKNVAALQFDHKHSKVHNISDMVRRGYSVEAIFEEVEKCDVRCANCHHIKTSTDQEWYSHSD